MTFGIPLGANFLDRLDGSRMTYAEAIGVVTRTGAAGVLYFLLILTMIRLCWRRMHALGLPGWSGLAVPLLFFLDLPFLLVPVKNLAVFGKSLGADATFPVYALMAGGLITAMTFVPERHDGENAFGRFGLAGVGAVLAIGFVLFCLIYSFLMAKGMDFFRRQLESGDQSVAWFLFLLKNSSWALTFNVYAAVAFVALLACCVVISRRNSSNYR